VRSERSVEQTREPMNKNWIRGLRCRASGQLIAKPTSIRDTGGKSSGCAWKAIELTSGDLLYVTDGIVTEGGEIHSDRAAEVSSGRSSRASDEGPNSRERQVGRKTR